DRMRVPKKINTNVHGDTSNMYKSTVIEKVTPIAYFIFPLVPPLFHNLLQQPPPPPPPPPHPPPPPPPPPHPPPPPQPPPPPPPIPFRFLFGLLSPQANMTMDIIENEATTRQNKNTPPK
ncbi:hypothetical protein OWV82_002396, partial [Melia azedarach]